MGFWIDTISNTLDLIHEMDEDGSGCLLLPDRYETRIYNPSHFPKMFFSWVKFCKFPYPEIMGKPTILDRGRMVDCTIRMGFREEPETF